MRSDFESSTVDEISVTVATTALSTFDVSHASVSCSNENPVLALLFCQSKFSVAQVPLF